MNEDQFGTGGIKSKYDPRDHKVAGLGMAAQPFDWNKGFDIETKLGFKIPSENQGASSSCGGQAGRYYIGVLKALDIGSYERLSAKDIYSIIFYPGGGTTIKDIAKRVGDHGVTRENLISSYENNLPPSENFMENKNLSIALADSMRYAPVSAYARTDLDFDSLASAVRDNNGAVIMIHGENNGTWLSAFPKAALSNYGGWNHFLYVGKAKMINGKKYLGALNSWGAIGENDTGWQWLSEDHRIFESLVFYDKATYTYTPTKPQAVISWMTQYPWIKGFLDWLTKYHWA